MGREPFHRVEPTCHSRGLRRTKAGFGHLQGSGWIRHHQMSENHTRPPPSSAPARTAMATDAGACIICLDTGPPAIQSGCACRGDGGLVHVDCLVELAGSQQAHRGTAALSQCQACEQYFTVRSACRLGLVVSVAGQVAESAERLQAQGNLANSLLHQGKHKQAKRVLRSHHEVQMRVYGAEHPDTLTTGHAMGPGVALSAGWRGCVHAHTPSCVQQLQGIQVVGSENTLARCKEGSQQLLDVGEVALAREAHGKIALSVSGCSAPSTRCRTPSTSRRSVSASACLPWSERDAARLAAVVSMSGCSAPSTRVCSPSSSRWMRSAREDVARRPTRIRCPGCP